MAMPYLITARVRFFATAARATVVISTENPPCIVLSVLHEVGTGEDVILHTLQGADRSEPLALESGEALTFIARKAGQVIACAVGEVTGSAMAAPLGHVLLIRCASNIEITQQPVNSAAELRIVDSCDDDLVALAREEDQSC